MGYLTSRSLHFSFIWLSSLLSVSTSVANLLSFSEKSDVISAFSPAPAENRNRPANEKLDLEQFHLKH